MILETGSLTDLAARCPELTDSDSLSFCLQPASSRITSTPHHTWVFHAGAGDLNSHLHARGVSTLPTDPSLVPASNQFLMCLVIKMPMETACPLYLKYVTCNMESVQFKCILCVFQKLLSASLCQPAKLYLCDMHIKVWREGRGARPSSHHH